MSSVLEVLQAVGVFLAGAIVRVAFVAAVALALFIPLLVLVAAGRGIASVVKDGHLALAHRRPRAR